MIPLGTGRIEQVAAVGAHCDDIAIGAGGALLSICAANPGVRVSALVLTGGGGPREAEERAALAAFCPDAVLEVTVLDLADGRVPADWARAKRAVAGLRARTEPQAVFAPWRLDAHQDHRETALLIPTEFRDHLILGYEIVKWDGDLGQPTLYVPLADEVARRKAALLREHYPSQHDRDWFDDETFLGLARIRGVQCKSRYAEAFHTDKTIVSFGRDNVCA